MKKVVSIMLALIMCIGIAGCSNEPKLPEDMSQETFNASEKVLEAIDEYLNADIDEDELYDRLDSLSDRIDSSEGSSSLGVAIYVVRVQNEINSKRVGNSFDIANIKEAKELIEKELYE